MRPSIGQQFVRANTLYEIVGTFGDFGETDPYRYSGGYVYMAVCGCTPVSYTANEWLTTEQQTQQAEASVRAFEALSPERQKEEQLLSEEVPAYTVEYVEMIDDDDRCDKDVLVYRFPLPLDVYKEWEGVKWKAVAQPISLASSPDPMVRTEVVVAIAEVHTWKQLDPNPTRMTTEEAEL